MDSSLNLQKDVFFLRAGYGGGLSAMPWFWPRDYHSGLLTSRTVRPGEQTPVVFELLQLHTGTRRRDGKERLKCYTLIPSRWPGESRLWDSSYCILYLISQEDKIKVSPEFNPQHHTHIQNHYAVNRGFQASERARLLNTGMDLLKAGQRKAVVNRGMPAIKVRRKDLSVSLRFYPSV